MVITGAGPGIMEAGIEGAGTEHAFGVNILLPFEQERHAAHRRRPEAHQLPLLLHPQAHLHEGVPARSSCLPGRLRHAWTRRFELLTLMQTGRTPIVPVVLLDEPGSTYWQAWFDFVARRARRPAPDLRRRPLPGPPHPRRRRGGRRDRQLLLDASTRCGSWAVAWSCASSASSRDDELADLGPRLRRHPQRRDASSGCRPSAAEIDDDDVPDLPRIVFRFDRSSYNRLRRLIDRLNGRA